MISLVPSENDPHLIFNIIFCVNTDGTLDALSILWFAIAFEGQLVYLKIKVFWVTHDFCFKLDIVNFCMLVDDFFNDEKQVVTIILSSEMSPLKQARMIV